MSTLSIKFCALAVLTSVCGLATTPAFAKTGSSHQVQCFAAPCPSEIIIEKVVPENNQSRDQIVCFTAPCPSEENNQSRDRYVQNKLDSEPQDKSGDRFYLFDPYSNSGMVVIRTKSSHQFETQPDHSELKPVNRFSGIPQSNVG